MDKIKRFFKESIRGYIVLVALVAAAGTVIVFWIVSSIAGLVTVYPLWLAATKAPTVFTAVFIIFVLGYSLFVLIRNLRDKALRKILFKKLKRILIAAIKIILLIGFLYPALLLFSAGSWLPALPFFIVSFFLLGSLFYSLAGKVIYDKEIDSRS